MEKELMNTVEEMATETAEAAQNVVVNLKLQDVALIGGLTMISVGVFDIAYELVVKPVTRKVWRKVKTKFVTRKLRKAKAVESEEEQDPMEISEEELEVN